MGKELKAPFPAFGGKSKIAHRIWKALGNVDNFIEPFFNSGATLLLRPDPPKIETANDIDCYIANFWRATKHDPEAVVSYADGPVNEADLHARHRYLVLSDDAAAFRAKMRSDPDYYDPKIAGWWCWGLCCWIGSGWCDAGVEWKQMPLLIAKGEGSGVNATCPSASNGPPGGSGERCVILGGGGGQYGHGIHAKGETELPEKLPQISGDNSGSRGKGIHAQGESHLRQKRPSAPRNEGDTALPGVHGDPGDTRRPQLADAYDVGRGVNASPPEEFTLGEHRPRISGPGQGTKYGDGIHAKGDAPWDGSVGTCTARRAWLLDWFGQLQDRFRVVRVCCGDFKRVMDSESVTTRLGMTGIYADPPYPRHQKGRKKSRSSKLYASDSALKTPEQIRDELLAYCKERGGNPMMRVVVSGYEGDGYEELVANYGWTETAWLASGGYGNRSEEGKKNAARERLWASPHCLKDRGLFDDQ
jgi:site-specific DNA-adenine methylase